MIADGRRLPFPGRSFDVLFADLPFGGRVGSHQDNLSLYPALLAEAARVTRAGGRFILITHEIQLMEGVLSAQAHWRSEAPLRVSLRGLHPRIYVLQRL